jgi:hypothetical protein
MNCECQVHWPTPREGREWSSDEQDSLNEVLYSILQVLSIRHERTFEEVVYCAREQLSSVIKNWEEKDEPGE